MTAKDAIKHAVELCDMVMRDYVEDLKDEELLLRSVPGANHIAWQLGHLAAAEHQMLTQLGRTAPALPAGFAESHSPEAAASDDPAKFHKKAEYLSLLEKMRAATLAAVDATSEEELDQPSPEAMREYAPTVGAVLMLLGVHRLMHAGQFVPIRRKLGKKPLF